MTGQKIQLIGAIVTAFLVSLLLVGISYILTPSINNMPLPMPTSSIFDQLVTAFLWLGLAATLAFGVVGALLLVNIVRNKKASTPQEVE